MQNKPDCVDQKVDGGAKKWAIDGFRQQTDFRISVVLMGVSYPGIIGMTRIEGDNLQEKRSRKEQRRDRQQHYEELERRHDAKALERFKRPAYQSVSVAEYLARKYDITAEVDTIADRRKRNDGK